MRAAAARVVHAVRARGRSLTEALADEMGDQGAGLDERDSALLQALCFGTLRQLPRLDALTAQLLHRPLQRDDRILKDLMAIGLYQLTAMRIPAHAGVAATVDAAALLGRGRAGGLVNALLRRFLRERETLEAHVDASPAARWLFPDWLLTRLQRAWPAQWQAIVDASNTAAPMTLRVNQLRTETAAFRARLAEQGLATRPLPGLDTALLLDAPVPMRQLPGFADGLVSVQDASAQWAAVLLDAQPGERVLDACAAPGGKSAHILERSGAAAELLALDADASRLPPLQETLARLGLRATVRCADAADPAAARDHAPFQRILLDAPCSATGVIRRHPDIKWLRRDSDIAALAATQQRLLRALWPLLAAGGRLLYATCSLLPEENEQQVRAFLQDHPDAVARDAALPGGLPRQPGTQLLPSPRGGDGFYYAVLEKAA